tara:strand:+ start:660 stop:2183 length:1524 start_codon:yes stop_codon:yes gene_type:complete
LLKKINSKFLFCLVPFLLGVLSSFSLPPYNLFILNFFTFPIFFIFFIKNYKKKKLLSFLIGWLFGFGYFISNLYWITNSLTFEEIFKPLIPFAFLLVPAFLGIFYGLATLSCSFFELNKNYSSLLIFSLMLSIVEFIRGTILSGFPWNLIAYSWVNYNDFLQILAFIGTYAFNLLSITLFLAPSTIFFNSSLKSKSIFIFSSILLILINFYYGQFVKNKYAELESIELNTIIKVISPKVKIDRFFEDEDPLILIEELIELSNPSDENAIFVFPEGILSNIFLEDIQIYKKTFNDSFSKNHKILLGINSNQNSKIYNSMAVLDNNLRVLSKYNKNKLVPFGEFLPLEKFLKKIGLKKITQGYISFSAADERKILLIENIRFLPLICYEIIYSGKINKNDEEYVFIMNISEDGWFGNSIGPHQHFSHSIFRSIEEGKNLIRSTNGGISAYVDAVGNVVDEIKSTDKGVIEVKSYKKTSKTFFSRYGNKIFFYFLIFYITLIFFIKKKGR